MKDENCVFCKIVAGAIPSFKVYEDDEVLAFLDIHPVSPGHTLVIPKAHFPDFSATPEEVLSRVVTAAQRVAAGVLAGTGASGFNLSTANGQSAGQEVGHLHFHIIPRKDRDEHKPWQQREYAEGEAAKIANAIGERLRNKASPRPAYRRQASRGVSGGFVAQGVGSAGPPPFRPSSPKQASGYSAGRQ
ncbi:MAG: HIT family protein [Patescibacteria group bacterium]|nr:HIT family protein [Patescibacteria group bacterium]